MKKHIHKAVWLRPDSASKKMRYRASLARARATVSQGTERARRRNSHKYNAAYYSNIRTRPNDVKLLNWDTELPYPINVQFKVRFFGFLHHITGHGPDQVAKRFKQADKRWKREAHWDRRISGRAQARNRPYM